MKIKTLEIENLFRYKKEFIDFEQFGNGISAIIGKNYDQGGADSNGSGKSSLFESIMWIIFGDTLRKSYVEDVITRGSNRGGGCLIVENKTKDIIKIKRYRTINQTGFDLELFVNGDNLTQRINTQQLILKYLDFNTYNLALKDFLNTTLLSRDTIDIFASSKSTPKERIELISRYIGIDIINDALQLIKEDIKIAEKEIEQIKYKKDLLEKTIYELGDEDILRVDKEQTENKIVEIEFTVKSLESKVDSLKNKIKKVSLLEKEEEEIKFLKINSFNIKNTIKELENKKNTLSSKIIEKVPQSNILEIEVYLKDIESNIYSIQQQINESKVKLMTVAANATKKADDIKKIERYNKVSTATCPICNTILVVKPNNILESYTNESHNDVLESYKKELTLLLVSQKELESDILNNNKKLQGILTDRDLKLKEKDALSEKIIALNFMQDSIKIILTEIEDQSKKEMELVSIINKKEESLHEQKMKHLTSNEITKNIDSFSALKLSLEDDIDKCSKRKEDYIKEIATLLAKISSLEKDIERLQLLKKDLKEIKDIDIKKSIEFSELIYCKDFVPKTIRHLIENFFPFFEERTNFYLASFNVTERVKFETLIEKKSSTKTEKDYKTGFNIQMWDGNSWANFDMFSEGERMRASLSIAFALRDLSAKTSGLLDTFFLCDEIADTLDLTGMEEFFSILRSINGQKFIISHKNEENIANLVDNIIFIERKNGESSVRKD